MVLEDLAVNLKEVEDRSKSNAHRLDEVEQKLKDNNKMLASIARIDQKLTDMDNDVKETKTAVKALEGKPAKRWDSIIDKILLGIIAALVAYSMSRIGF